MTIIGINVENKGPARGSALYLYSLEWWLSASVSLASVGPW